MTTLSVLAYTLGVIAVVAFGAAACVYAALRQRRQGGPDSPEFFLTARNSVRTLTVAWTFYAGAMGSWALFGPPSYCLYSGVLGVIFYSLASGIPIIVIAFFGRTIHKLVPNVLSMSDFVHRRFGLVVSLYVTLLMLFNMGVALTAEYTAVGDLFQYIIGTSRVPIVIVIGTVAIIYTAYGGLFVSIITDQWQAVCSLAFLAILTVYVAVTFRAPLGPLPSEPYDLTFDNYWGFAAIGVMPISLISSTLFSEAMWQRCWASLDGRTLILGSVGACFLVILSVFMLGFGGILAVWGNVWVPAGPDDTGNTILFSLFNNKTWVLVIVTLLSVTMSESAVDSLQNAVVDTISSASSTVAAYVVAAFPRSRERLAFIVDLNLWWIRGLVLVLNIPPIIVSLQGFNILQLFLLANLITTASMTPIMVGVLQGPLSRKLVTPFSAMFGCASGVASLFWWTAIRQKEGQSYGDALHDTFLVAYDYPPFLIGLGMSIVGLFFGALLEFVARITIPSWREYPEYDLSIDIAEKMRARSEDSCDSYAAFGSPGYSGNKGVAGDDLHKSKPEGFQDP